MLYSMRTAKRRSLLPNPHLLYRRRLLQRQYLQSQHHWLIIND